ncbi:Protein FAM184A [Labeo rohita]|uniref:Protein FAM184A n=1 Tax=Labeo rohita TaxID=84645 RepID=A0ABQ8LNI4_LABRO|nr:Protein FAM184A [Labeo rohita]
MDGWSDRMMDGWMDGWMDDGWMIKLWMDELEGTEEKFRNRESRPEDLQTIAELKDMVAERESLVKKLVDDKKFYQLELVNRETNFNKIFNANPNVGVINPLVKQKRKNDKSATRFSSSANLRANVEASGTGSGQPQPTRLEPIPNSPIHQLEPNTSKPLPPPTPLTEAKKLTREREIWNYGSDLLRNK